MNSFKALRDQTTPHGANAEMTHNLSECCLMNAYRQIAVAVKLWPYHECKRSFLFASPTCLTVP